MNRILFGTGILLFLLLTNTKLLSQQPIFAGNDTTVCQGPVTLTATIDSSLFSNSGSPTFLSLSDDVFSDVVNIGFNFTFFGNTYNQCVISSNNFISFNLANANTGSPWTISEPVPNTTFSNKTQNGILGPWQDINPGVGGTVSYQTLGTAPNRKFVVEYCNVPMYSCTNLQFSSQIIIYETTNVIETHIINKPLCTTWNGGYAIHALHDPSGTIAFVVAGRNHPAQWTAANEGYRFTPTGTNTYQIDPIPFQPALLGSSPTVTWYEVGNPTPIGNGLTVTVNPSNPSNSYVAVLSGSSCGSLNLTDTVTVFLQNSVPVITGDSVYCNGSSATLTTTQPYSSYVWSNAATTQTINVTAGTYVVTVTDSNGCTGSSQPFTVTEITPIVNISGVLPFCSGDTIILSATPGYASYSWNTGGTSDTLLITGGTYTVTVTDGYGCTNSASVDAPASPLPVPGFSAAIACYGQPTNFTDTSSITSGYIASWKWDFGDGDSSVNQNPEHTYDTSGIYLVTLTITSDIGCMASIADSITVGGGPEVEISAEPLCFNQLHVSATNSNTSIPVNTWIWDYGDLTQDTAQTATHTYQVSGTYNVTLTASDSIGCITTIQTSITTKGGKTLDQLQIPNVITPNGDNINDELVLDPEFEECSPYVLTIYNRWGIKVFEVENGGNPFAGISNTGSTIVPGTYFLVIRSGDLNYHGTLNIFITE